MTTLDVTVCACGVVMPYGYSGTLCVACTRRDLPRPSERLSPPDGPTAGAPSDPFPYRNADGLIFHQGAWYTPEQLGQPVETIYECSRSAGGCGMQSDDWDEYVTHRAQKHNALPPRAVA